MVEQLELMLANEGEDDFFQGHNPSYAIPDEDSQPQTKDLNAPASREEASEFLRQFRESVANPTNSPVNDLSSVNYSQSQTPTKEIKSTTRKPKKERKPRQRYRTPEEYRAFMNDASRYIGTSFGHHYNEKRAIILTHFKKRHVPSCPIQLGSMFERLYASAEKYSKQ